MTKYKHENKQTQTVSHINDHTHSARKQQSSSSLEKKNRETSVRIRNNYNNKQTEIK